MMTRGLHRWGVERAVDTPRTLRCSTQGSKVSTVVRSWSSAGQIWRNWAPVETGPTLARSQGRIWSMSAEFAPTLIEAGPKFSDFGSHSAETGARILSSGPTSGDPDRVGPDSGTDSAEFERCRAGLARFDSRVDEISACFPRSCATLVPERLSIVAVQQLGNRGRTKTSTTWARPTTKNREMQHVVWGNIRVAGKPANSLEEVADVEAGLVPHGRLKQGWADATEH